MVSIIITTLNGASTLNYLLDSINKQTYKNIEVILIDAGSKDNTIYIYDEFKFNNNINKIYLNNENEINIVDSYRKGLNSSSGDYVITMGHDDFFYDKKWLEESVELLEQNEKIGLVWGRSLILNHYLKPIDINPRFDEYIFDLEYTLAQTIATNRVPTDVNCIIRRNIFDICFPNTNDEQCFIFTPHHYFYLNFFELNYVGKFKQSIATCSINPLLNSERRQGKFKDRERKCSKNFKKKLFLSFIFLLFNITTKNLPKISKFHLNSGKLKIISIITLIYINKILFNFSISRIFNSKIIKKFNL